MSAGILNISNLWILLRKIANISYISAFDVTLTAKKSEGEICGWQDILQLGGPGVLSLESFFLFLSYA